MLAEQVQKAIGFEAPALLIKRFCSEHKVSEDEAREGFEETKKFLLLCAKNKGVNYSPSLQVDAMWHQFILHTRDYFTFCDTLGGFVHHQPAEVPTPGSYELTKRDLKRFYGNLNERFWGPKAASDCDDCSSSCDCCA